MTVAERRAAQVKFLSDTIELNPEGSREWNFEIPFVWAKNAGRPEFDLCVRWKRGKISDVFLTKRQQEDHGKCWRLRSGYSTGISLPYESNPWRVSWCATHKAQQVSVYVPNGTNVLRVSLLSTVSLTFKEVTG